MVASWPVCITENALMSLSRFRRLNWIQRRSVLATLGRTTAQPASSVSLAPLPGSGKPTNASELASWLRPLSVKTVDCSASKPKKSGTDLFGSNQAEFPSGITRLPCKDRIRPFHPRMRGRKVPAADRPARTTSGPPNPRCNSGGGGATRNLATATATAAPSARAPRVFPPTVRD